jgi:hypothetical protein
MTTMADRIVDRSWPSANLQCLYSLSARPREVAPSNHAALLGLLSRNIPCIVNLYLFKNQVAFFENALLVSGMSKPSRKHTSLFTDEGLVSARPLTLIARDNSTSKVRLPALGIASPHIRLPRREGRREERGHCVFACGFVVVDGKMYVRLRNSFGFRWGCMGDFTMALDDVCDDQVHKILYFEPSTVSVTGRQ